MVGLGNFECDRDLAGWFSARKVQNVRRNEAHGRSFASFSAQKFFQTQPRDLALLLRGNADLGGRGIVEASFETCKHLLSALLHGANNKNAAKPFLVFPVFLGQRIEQLQAGIVPPRPVYARPRDWTLQR